MQQLREHTARGFKIYLKKQITARFVASDHSWAFGFRHPSSSHLANFNDPGTLQKVRNRKVRIDFVVVLAYRCQLRLQNSYFRFITTAKSATESFRYCATSDVYQLRT